MKKWTWPVRHDVKTLVVGSGAAGLRAAERLHELGLRDIALLTEGMTCGTSRNTGSDKQTYYKLSLSGADADSVRDMASALFAGQAVDGDIALCEAAASAGGFFHLAQLGVPFPTNEYGEYVGYKTDHDPYRRATSAGPYTSKLMTEALERSVREKDIRIFDRMQAVELLTDSGRICGLLCLDLDRAADASRYAVFRCASIVWATGGPAGMYMNSVYPASQYGATGIALRAGAMGRNLTEWQFGLASLKPRWNVSGTYMQALPRFVSTDANGENAREFLPDGLPSTGEMLTMTFLKGYQWPFDVRKAREGSSRIDLLVHREMQKGRRVFLDFRENPGGGALDFTALSPEAFAYLDGAGACFGKPIDRLLQMNEPAVDFYREHGVDLCREPLEIALCVQHNNGGLAVDHHWRTNLPGLYAIGEAAATHGVYRPGGSALNAGQCGAVRAAEAIAAEDAALPAEDAFQRALADALSHVADAESACHADAPDVREAYAEMRRDMDALAGAVRSEDSLHTLLTRISARRTSPVRISAPDDLRWVYRMREMLVCQQVYVEAMLDYLAQGGKSRGSAMYLDAAGEAIPAMGEDYRFLLDGEEHARLVQEVHWQNGECRISWRTVRPMPGEDQSFERVWKAYRERSKV